MPLGSLIGGLLGEALDLRPTITLAAFGMLFASVWVFASPVRQLQSEPGAELSEAQ
jgi:predicted MFS family arabinose efflux permease